MAQYKASDYEFLRCEDGIYLGRALKNGTISKDSRKISDEEIVEMFSEVLQDYCLRYQVPTMEIKRGDKVFIEARLVI